jgi:hypothetical protein
MESHYRHWGEKEKLALANAGSFKELGKVVVDILSIMPGGVNVVSGPISTGGMGTTAANIAVFKNIVEILTEDMGLNILSWVPFEIKIHDLHTEWSKTNGKGYCMPILEDFYHAAFCSNKITKVHFIHGWESSFGARWEHELCDKLGIEKVYLSKELSQKALNRKSDSFQFVDYASRNYN